MQKDFIINSIIKEIQKDTEAKFNIVLSEQRVLDIINSEFRAFKRGFEQGRIVRADYFGMWGIRQFRLTGLEKTRELKEQGLTHNEAKKEADKYVYNLAVKKRKGLRALNEIRRQEWEDNKEFLQVVADKTNKTFSWKPTRYRRFLVSLEDYREQRLDELLEEKLNGIQYENQED